MAYFFFLFSFVWFFFKARRVRRGMVLGGIGEWEYEIGEEPKKREHPADLTESSANV
jgi:hypothetical protein